VSIDPNNVTFIFDLIGALFIRERLQFHSESDNRAKRWTLAGIYECTRLANVAASAFALLAFSKFIRPPKQHWNLQRKTNALSACLPGMHNRFPSV
jgi:hypothetical protein